MVYYAISILSLLTRLAVGKTSAQLCRGTAALSNDGNWYCTQVAAITYKNISQPGQYNRTTGVDPNTGLCQHETISYSGVSPQTPLIGELSMHLRGPMNVSQIAVYKLPDMSASKRRAAVHRRQANILNARSDESRQNSHEVKLPSAGQEASIGDIGSPALRQRWYRPVCSFIPTITTTLFVTDSMCGATHTPSILQSLPLASLSHMLPSPMPPTPSVPSAPLAPPVPPPPPPPEITTTVHDTTTVCPRNQTTSSARLVSELPTNSTSHQELCPCESTPDPSTSCTNDPITSTSMDAIATRFKAHMKRGHQGADSSASTPIVNPLQTDDVIKADASTWNRVAYYTSTAPAAATGFAFLANLGDPQKSGTFDYSFGNSLSYVIGDGSKVAADNTPFDGTLETSELEIAAFTDKVCGSGCEYARPDSTAHHGWDGPSKAFFIEFQMDHYNNTGPNQGAISDAPAWWFLNAAIPRILQYGNDRKNIPCSCWSTGCGEFDAFELLSQGSMFAKSTIHRQGNLEGGDSNYFLRPVGKTIKFVVVFYNWNITARILDDSFDFPKTLSQSQIDDILAYDANDDSHSLFAIGK